MELNLICIITMKRRTIDMKKIWLCAWCINGLCSHGEKIYQGNEIDERECEECREIDTCYECIEESD